MSRKIVIRKRYNRDGSISLVARGHVVHRATKDIDAVNAFLTGFLSSGEARVGRPIFTLSGSK